MAENIPPVKPKKRTKQENLWRRNITKKRKALGEYYVQHYTMNAVPPRQMRNEVCRHNCAMSLTEEEKHQVFSNFNALGNHEMQNVYLQKSYGANGGQKNWNIRLKDNVISVCLTYFLGLHGIKRSRLRTKVLNMEAPVQDMRGKHGKHRRTPEDVLATTRRFFQNLPARESHYSRTINPNKKYLGSNSSVANLYRKFISSEVGISEENLKLWQFRKIFNFEFNLSFGSPRSDVCETCERFHAKIQIAQLEGHQQEIIMLKNQQDRHWEFAEEFSNLMSKTNISRYDDSHGFFCFDYQKNLAFPLTNIGKEFFLRQLWLYNFAIHDLRTNHSYMFVYTENFCKKGSNEVLSFIKYFVENLLSPEVRHLHWFSDNSYGQNKNRYLLSYCQSICEERFDTVEICFPIVGHSRMQVDADFAIIEKVKRKQDKIHFPSEWVNIIRGSRLIDPFTVIYGNYPVTDNLQMDDTPIAQIFDFKSTLDPLLVPARGINEIRRISFSSNRLQPLVSRIINAEPNETFIVTRPNFTRNDIRTAITNAPLAYNGYLPVNSAKYQNVMHLLSTFYIPPEKTFYTSIVSLPQNNLPNSVQIINAVMAEYADEPLDLEFLDI